MTVLGSAACFAVGLISVIAWLDKIVDSYREAGLFHWIGADFRIYYSHALALRSGDVAGAYDLAALRSYQRELLPFAAPSHQDLRTGHVLYPALFSVAFAGFTFLGPIWGFVAWTAIHGVAAVLLAKLVADAVGPGKRACAIILLVSSFPLLLSMVLGQPAPLLALAVAQATIDLHRHADARAGLWLAALAMKPQYLVPAMVALMVGRRWRALGATIAATVVVAIGSLLVVGWSAIPAYVRAAAEEGDFHGRYTPAFPHEMINWRSLVLFMVPSIDGSFGMWVTTGLGVMTVLIALLMWRPRPHDPEGSQDLRVACLFVAIVLAGYHSHIHGALLLAYPLARSIASPAASRTTKMVIVTLAVLPTLMLGRDYLPLGPAHVPVVVALVLLILLCSMLVDLATSAIEDAPPAIGGASGLTRIG
jgi:hypothetical protein